MKTDIQRNIVKKTVSVPCQPAMAFRLWTEEVDRWWPKNHSLSGSTDSKVIFEGRPGGRFFERTSDGDELEWGTVTIWEPPHKFAYLWYLGGGREQPTQVTICFTRQPGNSTRVDVEHRSIQPTDGLWLQNKSGYLQAWNHVLPQFAAFCSGLDNPSF